MTAASSTASAVVASRRASTAFGSEAVDAEPSVRWNSLQQARRLGSIASAAPSPTPLSLASGVWAPLRDAALSTVSAGPPPQDGLYELSQNLQHQVHMLQAEMLALREERDNLRVENEVMGESLYGLQKENGLLHDMGMTSFIEKAELARTAEGHGSEASHLRLLVQQQDERIRALAAENAKLHAIAEEWQPDRAQLRLKAAGLEATLESVKQDLKHHVGRANSIEDARMKLERELQESRAERSHMDHVVTSQHIEIAHAKDLVAELAAERGKSYDLVQRLQTADMEIQRCYKEKVELDQLVSNLHVECAHLKTHRDSALNEVPNLIAALRSQGTHVTDLEAKVASLQQVIIDMQRHGMVLEKESGECGFHLGKTRQEAAHLEATVNMMQADNRRLRGALESMSAGRAEMDIRLQTAVTERGLIQSHMEQARAEREQLQLQAQRASSENAALKSRIVGLGKMVQGFQDEASSLHERVRLLRDEKEEFQKLASHPHRVAVSGCAQGFQGVAL